MRKRIHVLAGRPKDRPEVVAVRIFSQTHYQGEFGNHPYLRFIFVHGKVSLISSFMAKSTSFHVSTAHSPEKCSVFVKSDSDSPSDFFVPAEWWPLVREAILAYNNTFRED